MIMTRKEFKDLVLECYAEILREKSRLLMEDDKALDKDMVYGEGAELPDSTDQILAKFPTLKHCLERLQTDNGGAQQRDLPRYAGAIDQLASNHVVRTIQYQIDRHSIRLQKRRPVLLPQ